MPPTAGCLARRASSGPQHAPGRSPSMVAPSCRRTHAAGCRTRVGARQVSQCHSRELHARLDVELGEHRPQVGGDGVDRDEEGVGSGPVAVPFGDQSGHFDLGLGQRLPAELGSLRPAAMGRAAVAVWLRADQVRQPVTGRCADVELVLGPVVRDSPTRWAASIGQPTACGVRRRRPSPDEARLVRTETPSGRGSMPLPRGWYAPVLLEARQMGSGSSFRRRRCGQERGGRARPAGRRGPGTGGCRRFRRRCRAPRRSGGSPDRRRRAGGSSASAPG